VVLEVGRGDKSIYVKLPNRRIELSMISGAVEASAQNNSN